jgi:transcriptional regulator with XRE-family HTH domain
VKKSNTITTAPDNAVRYLRTRLGLTQVELAHETKLVPNDICRLEQGKFTRVGKYKALSKYFGVPIDLILRNDMARLFRSICTPVQVTHRQRKKLRKKYVKNQVTGDTGEQFVLQAEQQRLAGTGLENAINPNFADDPDAGFDIMSFTPDGRPKYIEVKSSTSPSANEPFYLSRRERTFMDECKANGWVYEIHRVYNMGKLKKGWKCKIYTLDDLRHFNYTPCTYLVTAKGVA